MCCMLHNIDVGLLLAEAALTASVESAVTVWPVHRCTNVSPALTALSRHRRDAGGRAKTSSVASHHDTFVVTHQSVSALVSE